MIFLSYPKLRDTIASEKISRDTLILTIFYVIKDLYTGTERFHDIAIGSTLQSFCWTRLCNYQKRTSKYFKRNS